MRSSEMQHLGEAVVLLSTGCEKTAASELSYALQGRLEMSSSGYVLLQVPNAIGNGAFQALRAPGIEQPISSTRGTYNAHVSVIRPDELERIGGAGALKDTGSMYGYTLGPVREITNPAGWDEMSKVWAIEVRSPDLMTLRRSLGLGPPKHPFHITFAVRRKRALNKISTFDIHRRLKQAAAVVIRESDIHGKGLFATQQFEPGDVLVDRLMTELPSQDERTRYEQSEESRFTNHRVRANATVQKRDGYVQLIAAAPIAKGEEVTANYLEVDKILGANFYYTYGGKSYEGNPEDHTTNNTFITGLLQQALRDKESSAVTEMLAQARKDTEAPKSPEQAEAGNYKKGRVRMHGLDIAIENPKGSKRSGTDPTGKKWSVTMKHDYGYIRGTTDADEDHVDVFIGPVPDTELAFVVDQQNKDESFDEHKVMLGFASLADAKAGYLTNYEDGWTGLQAITPLTIQQFRWWLEHGDQRKPIAGKPILLNG